MSESALARRESELTEARVTDLTSQLHSLHARMSDLQSTATSERTALAERHQAQLDELRSAHHHAAADMQAAHDRTHCQLAAALADNGALHARAAAAEEVAEARAQAAVHAERALQAREADLQVWTSSVPAVNSMPLHCQPPAACPRAMQAEVRRESGAVACSSAHFALLNQAIRACCKGVGVCRSGTCRPAATCRQKWSRCSASSSSIKQQRRKKLQH
jgi:hypothetical protein